MPSDEFRKLVSSATAGVVVDIGTGDGLFVYHAAKQNPNKLYIGIDSNPKPLEKISTKIYRKPAKGGASNVLYVHASAENLPEDLNGIANEVHVLFPWGNLLRGMASGDAEILESIKRICSRGAILQTMFALDQNKDESEIKRLGLTALSMKYVESVLVPRYNFAGFHVLKTGSIPFSEFSSLPTTWAKRLQHNKDRSVYILIANAR